MGNTRCSEMQRNTLRACASCSQSSHLPFFHFCPKQQIALLSRALETTQLETKKVDEYLRKLRNFSLRLSTHRDIFMLSLLLSGLVTVFVFIRRSWRKSYPATGTAVPMIITHTYKSTTKPTSISQFSTWVPLDPCFNLCFQADSYLYQNESRNKWNYFVFLYKGRERTWLVSLLFFKLSLKSHFGLVRSSVSILWQIKKSRSSYAVNSVP